MSIQRCIALLREQWRTALIATLILMGGAIVLVSLERPEYEASASVFVQTGTGTSVDERSEAADYASRQIASYTSLVTTPLVLDPVIANLDLDTTAETLATTISADVPQDTLLLTISVRASGPEEASEIANAVARSLRMQVANIEASSGPAAFHLTTVAPAVAPDRPSSPNVPLSLAVGALIALLAGAAVAILRGLLDDSVRGPQDLAALTDLPVLATIPEHRGPHSAMLPFSAAEPQGRFAESHRELRTNLRYLEVRSRLRSILVTSTSRREGTSTTALSLASSLARDGQRVLLIDANLRSPSLGPCLGLARRAGLTTALLDQATVEDLVQPTSLAGLSVLTSGPLPQNPGSLLDSTPMALLLKAASARYDSVIVDAPPALTLNDSTALAQQVSGTLLVVGSGRVRRRQLLHTLRRLQLARAPLLGIALTRTSRTELGTRAGSHFAPPAPDRPLTAAAVGEAHRPTGRRRRHTGTGAGSPSSTTHDPHARKRVP